MLRRGWITTLVLTLALVGAWSALLARPQVASAAAPLIVIDAGHGGPYSNANANRLREKDINLKIAIQLSRRLRSLGYRVVMVRASDRAVTGADIPTWNWSDALGRWSYANDGRRGYVGGIPKDDLQARVDIANNLGADLFISIHNNGGGRSARGTETWSSTRDPQGTLLSRLVQAAVVKRTKLRNRGAFRKDFYVLRWSNMPALLVEGAFITNSRDARLLRTSAGRRRIAWGIADGVVAWFARRPMTPLYPRTSAGSAMELASAVSATDFPVGSPAVVARAADAEAVTAASTLAATLGGPLLLAGAETTPGVSPSPAEAELSRLRPRRVIIAGRTGAFSEAWTTRLTEAAKATTSTVQVVEGADACELSVNLARAGAATAPEVVIARAGDNASVSQAARSASAARVPLLLIPGSTIGSATAAYLAERGTTITSTRVFGGVSAIPDSVLAGRPGLKRLAGSDRFQLAASELYRLYGGRGWSVLRPIVVDAEDPVAQALGNARAARSGNPVLLVSGTALSARTREWITNNRGPIAGFQFLRRGAVPVQLDWVLAKAERP